MNDSAKRNFHKKGMRGKWSRKDYTPEEIEYIKFIGLKIKKRRLQLGMTQSDVGKLIFGVSLGTSANIEKLNYLYGPDYINQNDDLYIF